MITNFVRPFAQTAAECDECASAGVTCNGISGVCPTKQYVEQVLIERYHAEEHF